MQRRKWFILIALTGLLVLLVMAFAPFSESDAKLTKRMIALRTIGDKILRQNGDKTSVVLPIREIGPDKYELAFEKPFSFDTDSIVGLFRHQAETGAIPKKFSVEVIDAKSELTSYAFELPSEETPCLGRANKQKEYRIVVTMVPDPSASPLWYAAGIPMMVVLFVAGIRRNSRPEIAESDPHQIHIGRYVFCPNSQRLAIGNESTALTAKETNVLKIFALHPNQVVPRWDPLESTCRHASLSIL